jgi:hypothetical protein
MVKPPQLEPQNPPLTATTASYSAANSLVVLRRNSYGVTKNL